MQKENICWDTSIFLTHILGKATTEQDQAIKSVVRLLKYRDLKIIISTLLYVEILESTMPTKAMESFDALIKNREMFRNVAVNLEIAKKAQAIRNSMPSLKTPDAIHIATAIVGKAIVFHTFDKKLIKLSGQDEVEHLKITPCTLSETNYSLF